MTNETMTTTTNSGPAGLDSDEIISLLETQRDVCRRLKHMTVQQRELVADGEPSRLLTLLADRRRLTGELARVSGRLGSLPDRLDQAGLASPGQRARAEELLAEVREVMGQIMAADNEDVKKLEIRKMGVGTALQGLSARREMLSAYSRPAGARATAVSGTDQEG